MFDYRAELINFYKNQPEKKLLPWRGIKDGVCVVQNDSGLGDLLSIQHLCKQGYEQFNYKDILANTDLFFEIVRYNPFFTLNATKPEHFLDIRQSVNFHLGNGHLTQRYSRALGFEPDIVPKPFLSVQRGKPEKLIVLNLHTYPHKRQYSIHPRAREIYPENLQVLQEFINKYNNYRFIEIGHQFSGLENVENKTNTNIHETINNIKNAEFFIGINSGPMILATALDIKSIVINNITNVNMLKLPVLKNIDAHDIVWLFPQNIHLHQDGETEFVPRFSLFNLEKAINGEVYPFWDNSYCNLVNEIKEGNKTGFSMNTRKVTVCGKELDGILSPYNPLRVLNTHHRMVKLIGEREPKKYLEIGCQVGHCVSFVALSTKNTHIYAVDCPNNGWGGFGGTEKYLRQNLTNLAPNRHTLLLANSQSQKAKDFIKQNSPYDIVFIDGDHSYEGCLADFNSVKDYTNLIVIDDLTNHPDLNRLFDDILKLNLHEKYEKDLSDVGYGILWLKDTKRKTG